LEEAQNLAGKVLRLIQDPVSMCGLYADTTCLKSSQASPNSYVGYRLTSPVSATIRPPTRREFWNRRSFTTNYTSAFHSLQARHAASGSRNAVSFSAEPVFGGPLRN